MDGQKLQLHWQEEIQIFESAVSLKRQEDKETRTYFVVQSGGLGQTVSSQFGEWIKKGELN
jgi:hypothetical protein